ncbi:MAG TPA: ankyrin repeat domain-containing protein, partial [Polyangium sp.]|nr:ankyrin repeat domain-containing protein [Polyangium sp.]
MFSRSAAKTNPLHFVAWALIVVAACSAREPPPTTSPDPVNSMTTGPGVWIAPVPATVVASAAPVPTPLVRKESSTDEELIREYQNMARNKVAKAELESFVSTHPKLLTVSARPYGPTIMWVLEYEYEEAALVLVRAGAVMPPSALGLAARGGLDGFVSYLLEKGADANGGADGGYSPLHQAAKYGHVSTVQKLLAAKAS